MSADNVRNAEPYAHAGGFKSALTLRTLILVLALIGALLVGQIIIDRAYGRGASAASFNLAMSVIIAFHGIRDILDAETRRAAGSDMSLRRICIVGVVALIAATALGTSAIITLIEKWSAQ